VQPGGNSVGKTIKISVKRIPSPWGQYLFVNVSAWHVAALHAALGTPGGPAKVAPGDPIVKVRDEGWTARAGGAVLADNVSAFQAFQTARAAGGFAAPQQEVAINLAGV
jgi:hypothetical protein